MKSVRRKRFGREKDIYRPEKQTERKNIFCGCDERGCDEPPVAVGHDDRAEERDSQARHWDSTSGAPDGVSGNWD